MDDVDFKTKVSRARLEAMCADMMPRWTQPILDALEMANLTMDDIKSVIMTGGAMRTPMVQAAIKATIGEYVLPSLSPSPPFHSTTSRAHADLISPCTTATKSR